MPMNALLAATKRVEKNSMKAWMRALRRRSGCVSTHKEDLDMA